jgi:PII-like signaling protein
MATEPVIMVRVYLARSPERRELLFRRLQQWEQLRGATVFQAIQGFGLHGVARGEVAPAVIEFFDSQEEVDRIVEDIAPLVDHIVFWPAHTTVQSSDPR